MNTRWRNRRPTRTPQPPAPRRLQLALLAGLFAATALPAQEQPPRPDADPPRPPQPRDAAAEDLGKRLIRKVYDPSEEDVMDRLIRLMGESAQRLEVDFDPGEETQSVQRRVMDELDFAIREAAARRRRSSAPSQSASADKRRRPGDPQPGGSSRNDGREQQGDSSPDANAESATPLTDAAKSGGELKDTRRAWGNLPPRERDEVVQGAEENSLERYRQWIERYYRALQESAE